jgi:hypothetical protein
MPNPVIALWSYCGVDRGTSLTRTSLSGGVGCPVPAVPSSIFFLIQLLCVSWAQDRMLLGGLRFIWFHSLSGKMGTGLLVLFSGSSVHCSHLLRRVLPHGETARRGSSASALVNLRTRPRPAEKDQTSPPGLGVDPTTLTASCA